MQHHLEMCSWAKSGIFRRVEYGIIFIDNCETEYVLDGINYPWWVFSLGGNNLPFCCLGLWRKKSTGLVCSQWVQSHPLNSPGSHLSLQMWVTSGVSSLPFCSWITCYSRRYWFKKKGQKISSPLSRTYSLQHPLFGAVEDTEFIRHILFHVEIAMLLGLFVVINL